MEFYKSNHYWLTDKVIQYHIIYPHTRFWRPERRSVLIIMELEYVGRDETTRIKSSFDKAAGLVDSLIKRPYDYLLGGALFIVGGGVFVGGKDFLPASREDITNDLLPHMKEILALLESSAL